MLWRIFKYKYQIFTVSIHASVESENLILEKEKYFDCIRQIKQNKNTAENIVFLRQVKEKTKRNL